MAIYMLDLEIKKIFAFIGLVTLVSTPGYLFGQQMVSDSVILECTKPEFTAPENHHHGLLAFYKRFISSQDGPSCMFTPSCSVYAYQSVKNKGLFMGWLSASDRLLRCYGNTDELYPTDDHDFYIDP